ncbi:hypothetical protein DH2020_005582 [Rehmannia glutinosa]|uniref:Endoglucanase n=1 Tax=Rehmannia glutinosa TaxID=99300 RepID=A0ABR0XGE3_REHGL
MFEAKVVTNNDNNQLCSSNSDYKDALSKGILFFEGQRSGKLPATQRVKWRADSALSDGNLENVNLSGGYYDAGDNVKFGWPMAFSVSLLSWAATEYKNEINSAKQLPNLRSAIKWGTDFLIRAHTSSTTLYTQVGEGNRDHECWERPEDMDTPRTLYKITSTSPEGEVAAEAPPSFFAAAIVFRDYDSKYYATLLRHLIGKYHIYLGLEFLAGKTSLSKYKNDVDSFVCALMPGSSSVQIKTTSGGVLYTRDSSNLQYVTSASMIFFVYSKILTEARADGVQCGSVKFSASKIKSFAKSQVDYILGSNPLKMSYMVGFGSKYPTQLHHRGASIPSIQAHPAKVGCSDGLSTYYSSSKPNPNTHVGAIVGGPDSNDHFTDSRSDFSHLEPTTYINAAFVGSVAALLGPTQQDFPHLQMHHNKSSLVDY